jgi:hypothetical protein
MHINIITTTMTTFLNILPLIGVIIGALLQFIFSKNKDNRQLKRSLETQAYTDYLKAIVGLSMAQQFNDESEKRKYLSALTESKSRIAIYGSKAVIQSLSQFERAGAQVKTEEQKLLFIRIGQTMRNSNINIAETVDDNDFSQLFFSIDMK